MSESHQAIARDLLQSIQLHTDELDESLERALSPEYWQSLAPELPLTDGSGSKLAEVTRPNTIDREDVIRRFDREGYLAVDSILAPSVTSRMHSAVMRVLEADWPPVFAWMFDEFWQAPRVAPVAGLLSEILGPDYRQTPFVWTHIVAGHRGASGWPPHVDNPGDAFRLTVWIPLTDATVDSGCICVLPRHLTPRSANGCWYEESSLARSDVFDLLHASRPLPAAAGSVLAWDAGVMHWGSARRESGRPRVSISMEFVGRTSDCHVLEDSFDGAGATLPTFEQRLRAIATGIPLYQSQEPRASRYASLCARLIERLTGRDQ